MVSEVLSTISSSALLKQVLVALSCCLFCVVAGCTLGFSAVLLPQIKQSPDFPYNDTYYDSWVASSACLAMVIGSITAGVVSDRYGRRITQLCAAPICVVGWITLACARDVTLILVGRVITGLCYGAFRSIGAVYLGEITNPTNRPYFIFCLTVSTIVGTLISHVLGGFFNWRLSCFIICVPVVLSIVLQVIAKESPLWLIYNGKIDQGTDVFIWFRGNDELTQKELAEVLEKHKDPPPDLTFKEGLNAVLRISFIKPLVTALLLFTTVQFSGTNTISFYAIDMMKCTFSGEIDPFMLMLTTDCARIIGVFFLFVFSRYVPRRSSFLITCTILVVLLVSMIAYIVVKPSGLAWLAITVMMMYIALGSMMVGLGWTFVGEIFPSNLRGLGSGISSSFSFFILFLSVNITPGLMDNYGVVVVYSTYAAVTFIALLFLFVLLPRTDGKTLQEIENSYSKKYTT